MLTIVIPVSTSRMPLFGAGDWEKRIGMAGEIVDPSDPAVKATPVSVSTVTPAAFRTMNVAELVDRLTPAPGVESNIVSTRVSSHEYLTLSSVTALCGNDEGPFEGAASAR